MKVLIPIVIGLLVVGCGKGNQTAKESPNAITSKGDDKNSATANPIKELTKEDVVGSYEAKVKETTYYGKMRIDIDTRKLVFLKNGTIESYMNGDNRAESAADWKIVGEEVQLDKIRNKGQHTTTRSVGFEVYQSKFTAIYKIEPDGDLTAIARIKGKTREDIPKDKQFSLENLNRTEEEWAKFIEKVIRLKLKKPEGELTKADFEKVTRLTGGGLYNKKLTSVKGLEKLTKLEELHLHRNKLTSVKGLEKLTQLERLSLWGNKLTDVKDLEKLAKLEKLYLNSNKLTEVPKFLEKLTQLKYLGLSGNKLTDVKGLENLTQLERLNLQDNPDLAKAQITELQKALPNCIIEHSFPLTKEESAKKSAKKIEKAIRKAANKIKGKLTKADYEKVTGLNFYNNQLTDVKGLEKLTKLENLILRRNPDLTKAQIDELQKALPNCKIEHNAKK